MAQKKYRQVRFDTDDMEIILEFPAEHRDDDTEQIQKEIKEILSSELQEKIRQIFDL